MSVLETSKVGYRSQDSLNRHASNINKCTLGAGVSEAQCTQFEPDLISIHFMTSLI